MNMLDILADQAADLFISKVNDRFDGLSEETVELMRSTYKLGYLDCYSNISRGYNILKKKQTSIVPESSEN